MSKSINMLTTGLALAVVGTVAIGLFTANPAYARTCLGPSSDPNGNGLGIYECPDPAPAPPVQRGPVVSKCMTVQNAMRPCTSNQGQTTKPASMDPKVVGTWDLDMDSGKWVLQVFGNGTYSFHSEAPDGVQSSSGKFSASNGNWSLRGSDGYTDGGNYLFQSRNIWIASGRFGPGAWIRRS